MRFLKRPLIVVAAALGLLASTIPAEAYNPSQRAAQRPRHGVTSWVPERIRYDHEHTMVGNVPYNTYYFGFEYQKPETRFEMDGTEQVLEINALMPCDSNGLSPFGHNALGLEGYDVTKWATNIPVLARPHEDTMFLDTCDEDSNNQVSVGFGVGDVSRLTHGTWYWVTLGTIGESGGNVNEDDKVKLVAQTGTNYDASDPSGPLKGFPQLDRTCSYSSSVDAVWNNQDANGGEKRNKAAWCTFIDYTHRYEEPGRLTAEPNNADDFDAPHYFLSNLMDAAGRFEGAGFHADWHKFGGTITQQCPGLIGPYQESCYASLVRDFNGDINFTWSPPAFYTGAGTSPTGEVEVRCPAQAGISECKFWIAVVGWNGVNGTQTESMTSTPLTIPDTNQWYHCRVDTEHRSSSPGFVGTWANDHPILELKIIGSTSVGGYGNLHVDNAYVGGRTKEESPANYLPGYTVSGVGHVASTNYCTIGTS